VNAALPGDSMLAPQTESGPAESEEARLRRAMLHMLEDLQAEREAIRQAHEQWVDTVDAVGHPMMVHDMAFRIVRANRAYAERAGMSFEELLGRPYWECFPRRAGPLPACAHAVSSGALQCGSGSAEEMMLETGEVILSRAFPVRDAEGAQVHAIHIFENITQKRCAEQERAAMEGRLRESEADLRQAQRVAGLGSWKWDAGSDRVTWSDELYRIFGRDPATPPPPFAEQACLYTPDSWDRLQAAVARTLATGEPYEVDIEIVAPSGLKWVTAHAQVVRDAAGRTLGMHGTALDITRRKLAETSLKQSEAQLSMALQMARAGHWQYDVAADRFTFNDHFYRIFRTTAAQAGGYTMSSAEYARRFVHPEDAPLVAEEIRKAIDTADPAFSRELEHRVLFSSGEIGHIVVRYFAAKDAQGRTVATYGVNQDITERKRDEEAMRTSERRLSLFRTLIDHAQDMIVVLDPDSLRILDANERACLDLGYSREELLALHIPDVSQGLDVADRQRLGEEMARAGFAVIEDTHRRKDGSTYPVEVNVRRIQLDRAYSVAVVRNITERRRAEQAVSKLNRSLRTLSAGNEALVRASDEPALLRDMSRILVEVGGYKSAWIAYARDDAEKSVEVIACHGEGQERMRRARLSWNEGGGLGPTATAIRRCERQVVRDLQSASQVGRWGQVGLNLELGSVVALPLRLDHACAIGALCIGAAEASAFDDEELSLLEELANDLSYGIASLRAHEERRGAGAKLRRSLEATIEVIAATMETRDPYTAGHQRRVADLARAIGREMGLAEAALEGIHFGALIHDLGKIQVPAEILAKPTRLSKLEFDLIKTHPQAGYDIIKGIEFPWPVADLVHQHHERLDGSGYPQGLKGEAIALEARILAVADVVEAMASHRPYRAGRGIDAALAEIEAKRGIWFDEKVVDACLCLFREARFTLPAGT
jgi:PAS domain S-box-containing protein